MRGFTKVVIIDALKGGHRYGSAHSIGLDTALELGHRLGFEMPEEVIVYAVETVDVETFGVQLSPPVAAAAERVLEMIRAELGMAGN